MQLPQSVYANNDYSKVNDLSGRISVCGMELETCERLLKMGYTRAGSVDIAKHAKWCENEIARLEDLKRTNRWAYDLLMI